MHFTNANNELPKLLMKLNVKTGTLETHAKKCT